MIGNIVTCTKGSEMGERFFVTGEEEDFLLLVNGKRRTMENPKRKRKKHTRFHGAFSHEVVDRLQRGEVVTNRDLRRALAAHRDLNDLGR